MEFYLREITQGSKKKTYGPYVGEMKRLKTPIELKGRVIQYKPVAKLSKKLVLKKGGMIDGGPAEAANNSNIRGNSVAGPAAAANNSNIHGNSATGPAAAANNSNIHGNSAAGPALAHSNSNNKKLKELCKKAIQAIRNNSKDFPGSSLPSFKDLKCLEIAFDNNELRRYNAIFIKNQRSWQTVGTNIEFVNQKGKKDVVERFISELKSDMFIDQNFKEAWYCVIYNAFQNFQIAFPQEEKIAYPHYIIVPIINEQRPKTFLGFKSVENKSRPEMYISQHGFVNDFPKPDRYDQSGLKQIILTGKKI